MPRKIVETRTRPLIFNVKGSGGGWVSRGPLSARYINLMRESTGFIYRRMGSVKNIVVLWPLLLFFFFLSKTDNRRRSVDPSITVERRSFPERNHETEKLLFVIKQK